MFPLPKKLEIPTCRGLSFSRTETFKENVTSLRVGRRGLRKKIPSVGR